jgi:hypothetical protein
MTKASDLQSITSGCRDGARPVSTVVIARRNDEAIRLLSAISGLLHSVTDDDRMIAGYHGVP